MNKLYDYFEKLYKEDKISQAFLIGNVLFDDVKDDLNKIFKEFIFENNLDIENNPDVMVFNLEDNVLDSDTTKELLNYLSTTSQISNKKVYIIQNCENLHKKVVNALLKTIEEPGPGIYAILLTSNIANVLPTIVSRCQKIFISSSVDEDVDQEEINEICDILIESIETVGILTIGEKYDLYKKIKNREMLLKIFKNILKRYHSNLILKANEDVADNIIFINNDIIKISKKLLVINEFINKLKFNLNVDLTLDNFIIKMWRCNK